MRHLHPLMLVSLPRIHWLIHNVRRGPRIFCVWEVARSISPSPTHAVARAGRRGHLGDMLRPQR